MKYVNLVKLGSLASFSMFLMNSSELYSNSLRNCCGLLPIESPQFIPPVKEKFTPPKRTIKPVPSKNVYSPPVRCRKTSSVSSVPSTPAMFYYAPRMKSIRVSSPPNIEGWERSLRNEMRLNGRSKQTVDRLLARIQKYYGDPSIEASDYTPGNEGYLPSRESRELAELRILRSVESTAEFYKKSNNPYMDAEKSSNGNEMAKGKLAFINTQLDKLGKERVSMDDFREIVGLKINPPFQAPVIADLIPEPKEEGQVPIIPAIAGLIPEPKAVLEPVNLANPQFDKEVVVEERVIGIYHTFANWLADNDKVFPSLDPEVDALTIRYFDRVNRELRELGKFENMQIFREKTLAYLDDVLDDRGQHLAPGEIVPENIEFNLPGSDDPLFRTDSSRSFVHLASLPGKVISAQSGVDRFQVLPGKQVSSLRKVNQFDSSGNKRSFRVMNNLPGKVIY